MVSSLPLFKVQRKGKHKEPTQILAHALEGREPENSADAPTDWLVIVSKFLGAMDLGFPLKPLRESFWRSSKAAGFAFFLGET